MMISMVVKGIKRVEREDLYMTGEGWEQSKDSKAAVAVVTKDVVVEFGIVVVE